MKEFSAALETRDFGDGFDGLAHGEYLDFGVGFDALVEAAEKFAAVAGVIFPGVFAVEDNADGGGSSLGFAIADGADAAVKILGGRSAPMRL